MKARCDPEGQFADRYAQRGIVVCERWSSFENFWADMGASFAKGLTLEREDNDRGYEPGNCVWADYYAQASNTRRNRWIDTPSGPMTMAQASRAFGINVGTLASRVKRGVAEDRLFMPART